MRIGILTFHSVDNYGAVLQAFALQRHIQLLGHDVEIIDYRPKYFHPQRKWSFRPARIINNIALSVAAHKFERFRDEYLMRTAICYNREDLEAKLPHYDVVIVGSDQVWSPDVDRRRESDPIYFFDWKLPEATKRISYAASFGTNDIPIQHRDAVKNGLMRIEVISVREHSGIDVVKNLSGKDAKCVCDPVFLLANGQWRELSGAVGCKRKGYVCYMPPSRAVLTALSRVIHGNVMLLEWNPYYKISMGLDCAIQLPLQWVRSIASAEGMITQSFHGTAFSILLHTPFVYVRPVDWRAGRSTRITDLLARLDLQSLIIDEDVVTAEKLEITLRKKIDWARVDGCLAAWRSSSVGFIKSQLM